MKKWLVVGLTLMGTVVGARAQMDSFPYEEWTSMEGKKLTARLVKMSEKEVTLQAQKGGRRYTLNREKLSDESNAKLAQHREAVVQELRKNSIGARTIYKAAMVGVADRAIEALEEKTVGFRVTDIRIEGNSGPQGYLVLDEILFLVVKAPKDQELFEQKEALWRRPAVKRREPNYFDRQKKVNEDARLIAREKALHRVSFRKESILELGTVGITDGVIIHP